MSLAYLFVASVTGGCRFNFFKFFVGTPSRKRENEMDGLKRERRELVF